MSAHIKPEDVQVGDVIQITRVYSAGARATWSGKVESIIGQFDAGPLEFKLQGMDLLAPARERQAAGEILIELSHRPPRPTRYAGRLSFAVEIPDLRTTYERQQWLETRRESVRAYLENRDANVISSTKGEPYRYADQD